MKTIISVVGIFVALSVAGCDGSTPKYKETSFTVRPPELADCKIYELYSKDYDRIYAASCPAANTTTATYKVGKHTDSTIMVNGVTYTTDEKQQPVSEPAPQQQ